MFLINKIIINYLSLLLFANMLKWLPNQLNMVLNDSMHINIFIQLGELMTPIN
jgi:hypothetical protein